MKVAVFIAGPYRFAHLVQNSLDRILGGISYDIFYHIWKEDLGNKVRIESEKKYSLLLSNTRTKAFILAEPYLERAYEKSIGTQTNSNSSINATMGMFLSMSTLSNYLESLPDKDEYTHVFRIRTDCLIFNCLEKLIHDNQDKVIISNNFFVPYDWISDHIMIAPKSLFYQFWRFNDMKSIFKAYNRGKRNPEKTLRHLGKSIQNKIIKVLNRGVDYHIIYTPPKETDPAFIQEAIDSHGIEHLFDNISKIAQLSSTNNPEQLTSLKKKQAALKDQLSNMARLKSLSKSTLKKLLNKS